MGRGRFRAKVLTWDDIISDADSFPDSDPDLYHQKILSEGDSWFTLGGIPTSNLLFELRFHEPTLIVNIAMPGDSIVHMSRLSDNAQIKETLGTSGFKWNAILLSGGGNDLVDNANDMLLSLEERSAENMSPVDEYCHKEKLDSLIDKIKKGYKRIVGLRDQEGCSSNNVPILTHTYDYATPRNSPARFFGIGVKGPWIYRAFVENKIPKKDWLKLSDYLLDRLAEGHLELAGELKEFHVVDTRKKLVRAALGTTGADADWLNEFHPNGDGYTKMAKALEPSLNKLLS